MNCTQTRHTYDNIQYGDTDGTDGTTPSSVSVSNPGTVHTTGSCGAPTLQTRPCNIDTCPIVSGDYMVIVDMHVNIPAIMWSHAYSNTFEETFAELFMVREVVWLCELWGVCILGFGCWCCLCECISIQHSTIHIYIGTCWFCGHLHICC